MMEANGRVREGLEGLMAAVEAAVRWLETIDAGAISIFCLQNLRADSCRRIRT